MHGASGRPGQAGGHLATRKASQQVLDAVAPLLPELLGGSADLTGSNLTDFKGCREAGPQSPGNSLHYGVREFGMAAMMNGMALHGGLLPSGGTFLPFSDYSRNAIRMAALMKQRVIHGFTHDSIGLGEDGPTHQPVEHLASLRLIPNLDVWRPADTAETAVAMVHGDPTPQRAERAGAVAPEPPVVAAAGQREAIARGGYVLRPAARPCCRATCRPWRWRPATPTPGTNKYVGLQGGIVGMHGFGESAPGQ